jgi:hypothetical protein
MVGDTRQGWVVLATMAILFALLISLAGRSEQQGNPLIAKLGVDQTGATWVRCEAGRHSVACEWTERDGSCTRIQIPAMTVVRAEPLRESDFQTPRR